MIKLITPPGMLLTVALLAIYSAYAFLIGLIENSFPLLIGGVLSVVASYGVAMLRPWSRGLVYLLTAGFVGKLALSVFDGVQSGYFAFQFGSLGEALRSMFPAVLMVLLSFTCCFLVSRHFRPAAAAGPQV
jgi:hypothetical protein